MTVAIDNFGPHHWQLLLVLEGANVARIPLDLGRLRVAVDRHPALAASFVKQLPTILRDGSTIDTDDIDCLDDLVNAGLVLTRAGRLTDRGWAIAAAARKHTANARGVDRFHPDELRACPAPDARPPPVAPRIARRDDHHVDVVVGGLLFCFFLRERATPSANARWEETCSTVGTMVLDARFIADATVAARDAFERVNGAPAKLRCGECNVILSGTGADGLSLDRDAMVTGIDCGPEHVVRYEDGVSISVSRSCRLERL
jgi:hypothetical protein